MRLSLIHIYGNKEVWEPVRRPGLIRLDDIEILNQYNAEVRGMYNYYRLANNATAVSYTHLPPQKEEPANPYPELAAQVLRFVGEFDGSRMGYGLSLIQISRWTRKPASPSPMRGPGSRFTARMAARWK